VLAIRSCLGCSRTCGEIMVSGMGSCGGTGYVLSIFSSLFTWYNADTSDHCSKRDTSICWVLCWSGFRSEFLSVSRLTIRLRNDQAVLPISRARSHRPAPGLVIDDLWRCRRYLLLASLLSA
jgi:hypothetical protein